ncbi:MAG: hypothetical protein Q9227_004539 [Pyrenula ochraceoflavens]
MDEYLEKRRLKIPQHILDTVNSVVPHIGLSLVNLPNEILLEIFDYLNMQVESTAYLAAENIAILQTSLALTCKTMCKIGVKLRIENPIAPSMGFELDSTDENDFLLMLAKGWNRDRSLSICQMSGRFARNTINLGALDSDDRSDVVDFAQLEQMRKLSVWEKLNYAEPICHRCVATRKRILNLTRHPKLISPAYRNMSVEDNETVFDWAMNQVAKEEQAEGRGVYF